MENFEERLKKIREFTEKDKQRREELMRKHWENLPKFDHPDKVPALPRVETEEWKNFYVPKLINAGGIPKKDLVNDQIYVGGYRAGRIAKWNENDNRFYYKRQKFNYTFYDICNHFEDDDGYALFVPIRIANDEEINDYNRIIFPSYGKDMM